MICLMGCPDPSLVRFRENILFHCTTIAQVQASRTAHGLRACGDFPECDVVFEGDARDDAVVVRVRCEDVWDPKLKPAIDRARRGNKLCCIELERDVEPTLNATAYRGKPGRIAERTLTVAPSGGPDQTPTVTREGEDVMESRGNAAIGRDPQGTRKVTSESMNAAVRQGGNVVDYASSKIIDAEVLNAKSIKQSDAIPTPHHRPIMTIKDLYTNVFSQYDRVTVSIVGSRVLPAWHALNSEFTMVTYQPALEDTVGELLRKRKQRVAVLEATTGGLISSSLLSVAGASQFFISGAIVYTGRGAKRILPKEVLDASKLFDREQNYLNKENYVASKIKYAQVVSKAMRTSMKADWALVESGTSGPDFFIPGVNTGFTAVGVAGPNDFSFVKVFEVKPQGTSQGRDRVANMQAFNDFALETFRDALIKEAMSTSAL